MMSSSSAILTLDRDLTLSVNGWHSPSADLFFYLYSCSWVWSLFFATLLYLLWREYGWRVLLSLLLAAAAAVLLSDQICNIFKYTVCRLRPTHDPSLAALVHTVNGYLGGDYGFCSSHAANTAALTLFTSLVIRRWPYSLSLSSWVLLSCWSRVYLGVHYVGDILCGLAVGLLVSTSVFHFWSKSRWGICCPKLSSKASNILICCYFATTLVLLVCSLTLSCQK